MEFPVSQQAIYPVFSALKQDNAQILGYSEKDIQVLYLIYVDTISIEMITFRIYVCDRINSYATLEGCIEHHF